MRVKWIPQKNTERTAIQKFGDLWEVIQRTDSGSSLLIQPLHDGNDMRWINKSQVVKEIL